MRLIDADALFNNMIIVVEKANEDVIKVTSELFGKIKNAPTIDAVQVVRCKDCKYRIVNEHYVERGYLKLKAYCDLDTGDPFELGRCAEDDNWFCADGERRTDETD